MRARTLAAGLSTAILRLSTAILSLSKDERRPDLRVLGCTLIAGVAAVAVAAAAFGAPAKKTPPPASEYVGSKLCLACHIKFAKKWPELPHSKILLDPKRKAAEQGCEACHGPGRKHTTTDRKAIVRFSKLTDTQKADICLKCHAPKVTTAAWKQSAHAKQDISCTICHDMHTPETPAKMLRAGFGADCRCHGAIRDKAANGEHHKLPEVMLCTACHTPHGSANPSGLVKPRTDLCRGCHGESGGMPESHQDADWKKTHGKTEDGASCGACHGKEETCTRCHGGVKMPHPSGWIMGHKGQGASLEGGSPCSKCHDKKEYCGRCHADKV